MIQGDVRDLLRREPFEPFRVRLTSGDVYEVRNPHSVALLRNRLFIVVRQGSEDGWTFIPYLHIAALETVSNGRSRKLRRQKNK